MSFIVEWALLSQPVDLSIASQITGTNPEYIKQMYRSGSLGPAPDVAAHVAAIPLYHLAALLVLLDSSEKRILSDQICAVLPVIAGAVFVRLQIAEVAAGRCVQRGGTPKLNIQLWTKLRSNEGKAMLEERLPGGPVQTHRYAWFNSSGCATGPDLSQIEGSLESWKIIDAWEIASQMKRGLPGTLFATTIG